MFNILNLTNFKNHMQEKTTQKGGFLLQVNFGDIIIIYVEK